MHDPFGYYIPKPITGSRPDGQFIYMEDFPIVDSSWVDTTILPYLDTTGEDILYGESKSKGSSK